MKDILLLLSGDPNCSGANVNGDPRWMINFMKKDIFIVSDKIKIERLNNAPKSKA